MLTSEELCSILGVSSPTRNDRLIVRPTLVHVGEEFSVSIDADGTISVVSPDGRVLNSRPCNKISPMVLNTTGWPRGCYLVCSRDLKNRVIGTARISIL